ncbi:unnamed protein product [Ceratitis capitata]|uniref:(Mediterranean fruit fly) hypothetical protein n=1 Tax=Ceratitis capitata TaxID=7213 RepID=A0A811UTU0_CERCA|nr:unnamed protein product [Ceratitis capitata]
MPYETELAGEDRVDRADREVQNINRSGASQQQQQQQQQQTFGSELSNSFNFEYSERPPPLGQCASPVDLEQPEIPQPQPQPQPQSQKQTPIITTTAPTPTRHLSQCKSPYDNIPMSKVQVNHHQHYYQPPYAQQQQHSANTPQPPYYQQQQQAQQTADYYKPHYSNNNNLHAYQTLGGEKLFISRHQNIDELLGGSCRPLSPLFLDGSQSFAVTVPANRNLFIEEITPDQVRIHDSTAQMPVIQRMERDEWDNYGNAGALRTPAETYEQKMVTQFYYFLCTLRSGRDWLPSLPAIAPSNNTSDIVSIKVLPAAALGEHGLTKSKMDLCFRPNLGAVACKKVFNNQLKNACTPRAAEIMITIVMSHPF